MKKFFINLAYFISYSLGLLGVSIVLLIGIDTAWLGSSLKATLIDGGDGIIIGVAMIVSIISFIVAKFLSATQKNRLKIISIIICVAYVIFNIIMLVFFEPNF
jgi:hypothetical protein